MSQRKSNMELLRIFSMYLIVLYHFAYHSGFPAPPPRSTYLYYNMWLVNLFWFFGELGVNLFILTTGYFQVNSRFKWGKLISLLVQTLFYSVLTYCIVFFAGGISLTDHKTLLKAILPIIGGRYWFATAYVVVYLFSPYLNGFIHSIDRKTFRRFLLMALVLYCAIPTVCGFVSGSSEGDWFFYNRMIWLFIMYFVGAYIRLYSLLLLKSIKRALICACSVFALMAMSMFAIYALDVALGISREIAYFWHANTVPMLALSVGTFCVFLQLKCPYTSWINRVASTTFGIYLFHAGALWNWMCETFTRFEEKCNLPSLIPEMLVTSAVVFLLGMTVDFARQALECVTLKKWLASEQFLRLEARFDMNNMNKET